jgi:hypothetical protein
MRDRDHRHGDEVMGMTSWVQLLPEAAIAHQIYAPQKLRRRLFLRDCAKVLNRTIAQINIGTTKGYLCLRLKE